MAAAVKQQPGLFVRLSYRGGDEKTAWKKLNHCATDVFHALNAIPFQLHPGFTQEEQKKIKDIIQSHVKLADQQLHAISLVLYARAVIDIIKEEYSSHYPSNQVEQMASLNCALTLAEQQHVLFYKG